MNYYKVRFKPYDAKRKINRLGILINESDVSMFFKEVTDKGEDKLSFDKRNNRASREIEKDQIHCLPRTSLSYQLIIFKIKFI